MKMEHINNYINENKIVPVFYDPSSEVTIEVIKACHAGGIKILEFTNRGDFAWEVFKEAELYCRKNLPDMILGAGSISDATMANLYISTGANFIVGPLTSKEVASASPFSISIKESSGMLFVVFISNKKGGIKPPLNYISIIRIYI